MLNAEFLIFNESEPVNESAKKTESKSYSPLTSSACFSPSKGNYPLKGTSFIVFDVVGVFISIIAVE